MNKPKTAWLSIIEWLVGGQSQMLLQRSSADTAECLETCGVHTCESLAAAFLRLSQPLFYSFLSAFPSREQDTLIISLLLCDSVRCASKDTRSDTLCSSTTQIFVPRAPASSLFGSSYLVRRYLNSSPQDTVTGQTNYNGQKIIL